MKNRMVLSAIVATGLTVFGINASADRLLTQEEALKQMFPDATQVTPETKKLTDDQSAAIKARLGGSLVHMQKGSKSAAVEEKLEYTFFTAVKGTDTIGVAVIDLQPGKWGPVEYIVAVDAANAKIKNMAVMSYTEKRGRPIAGRNFLDQFEGKSSSDTLEVHKDIRAISGATISSEATCFCCKKVMVLYEELYLKKK